MYKYSESISHDSWYLTPQALAAGAAVSRGVSRRPIGGPAAGSAAAVRKPAKQKPAQNAAAPPAAAPAEAPEAAAAAADGLDRQPDGGAADVGTASGLAAELEAAMSSGKRGDLFEGEDTEMFDGGNDGGSGVGGGKGLNKRKKSGPLGGRLRKKLARQRAAAKSHGPKAHVQ